MGESVAVSVVLPAYDEEATIADTVRLTLDRLDEFLPAGTYEVLVAEDGCTDRTPEIADRLAAEDDRVRHVHSEDRLGRGKALERAFGAARGDTLAYFDTDVATDMRHVEELIESVRSGAYDVATGSRWIAGHEADRPPERGVPSRVYNGLVRVVLRSSLQDHQCGFKSISREAFEALSGAVEDEHWFWDTELLVLAQRRGYRVKEFPVDWEPKGDSKVDLVRDVFGMGSQILRTWYQLSVRPRATRRTALVAGTALTIVALALMTLYIDPSAVLDRMAGADPVLVAAAAGVYALSWPVRGLRYRTILRELGYTERLGFLTGAIFVSQTGNLVFPARAGDAVRAYVMKARRSIPYTTGLASLAAERVFDLLSIAAIAGVVFLGLAATGEASGLARAVLGSERASGRIAVVVAGVVGFAAVVAVTAIVHTARSDRSYAREVLARLSDDSYVRYVAGAIEGFAGDLQTVAGSRSSFASVGATSLVVWTLDVVTALLVLTAIGVDAPPVALVAAGFFAVSVGNLAKVLPLSPGGVGLYEGAFSLLIVALTPIPWTIALGAAILDHALKNGVTVVGGVVATLGLNVSLTAAVDEAPTDPDAADAEAD
ncbi:glycosyl transferase [Halobacteriales archaeon SW_7_68_16]|nr:MAG: glycosyl transferase [Halobacteriales archaeon SW_7_68_16]